MSGRRTGMGEVRRRREHTYRWRLRWCAVASALLHAALFVTLTPLRNEIPLVRHIGYEGAMRILPEISVRRAPGPDKGEFERTAGPGSRAFVQLLDVEVVSEEATLSQRPGAAQREERDELGDELLTELERSLPQPQSTEIVVSTLVKPQYPRSSIAAGAEGVVIFRLHVSEHGIVERVWLLGSEVDEPCEDAARKALLRWRFRPFYVGGAPRPFLVDQTIRFRLTDALERAVNTEPD